MSAAVPVELPPRSTEPQIAVPPGTTEPAGWPASNLNWSLWLVLLVALVLRVPGLNRPLLGNFATKNAIYAMIARNWARGETTHLLPMIDTLHAGRPGWHLVEYPASAYVVGSLWSFAGGNLAVWGRCLSVLFSLLSVALLYHLVRRWHSPEAGAGAAWTMALSPVGVIIGQSFMLEPGVVLLTLLTLAGVDRWLNGRTAAWLVVGAASFALVLLSKIYMLVLGLPLAALLWQYFCGAGASTKPSRLRGWTMVIALALAIIPASVWYAEAYALADPARPTAERIYYSVRQSATVHAWPPAELTDPAFFAQVLMDLAGPVLGPGGSFLLLLGLTQPSARRFLPWVATSVLLMAALPLKFTDMLYYHLVTLPPFAAVAGVGWARFVTRWRPSRFATSGIVALALLISLRFIIKPAFITPAEDQAVPAAAAAVRAHAALGDRVVTLHGTSPTLLYHCDRRGWVVDPRDPRLAERLAACVHAGARWVILVDPELAAASSHLSAWAEWQRVQVGDGFALYAKP